MTKFNDLEAALANILFREKIPLDIWCSKTGRILIMANKRIGVKEIRALAYHKDTFEIDPSPIRAKLQNILLHFENKIY